MAVKELRVCPATSAHPGLPLETKVELTQNGKESYLTLRNLEVKCRLFSYFSAACTLSFQAKKEKPCRITLHIYKAAFIQGS